MQSTFKLWLLQVQSFISKYNTKSALRKLYMCPYKDLQTAPVALRHSWMWMPLPRRRRRPDSCDGDDAADVSLLSFLFLTPIGAMGCLDVHSHTPLPKINVNTMFHHFNKNPPTLRLTNFLKFFNRESDSRRLWKLRRKERPLWRQFIVIF